MKKIIIPMVLMLIPLLAVSEVKAMEIDSCQELNIANEVYVLTTSITDHSGDCFLVTANDVTLDCGDNTVDGIDDYHGLTSINNERTIVRNCIFTDWGDGILFDTNINNGIIENTVSNSASSTGFYIIDSHNVIVRDTTTNNNDIGIVLEFCYNCTLENVVANNNADSGIWMTEVYDTVFEDITTDNNVYGITFESIGNLTLDNVSANYNDEYGIWGGFLWKKDYTIKNCLLKGNLYGILLDYDLPNGVIFNNRIINNSKGIVFGDDSSGNTFYNNLIYNVDDNVFWVGAIGENYWNTTPQPGTRVFGSGDTIAGNFWSFSTSEGHSYTCTDADSDDFCDSSLTLAASNIDYLPLFYREAGGDSDGDGLTDDEENTGWDITQYSCAGTPIHVVHVTSDPNIADEDGDGLNDYEEREGWHVSYVWSSIPVEYDVYSHPKYADIDMDGLNDLQERTAGTDPNRANTDCDGAWDTNDGFEVDHGMDPLDSDTDGDGITDGEEIDMWIEEAGYDPTQPEEVPPEVIEEAAVNTNDVDTDDDGVNDGEDNCPNNYNPDQTDFDLDGKGDVCDICPIDPDNDVDGDGVCGDVDNCPLTYNPDQLDIDGDDIGDVCDACIDIDGDGYGTGEGCLGLDCDDNNPAVYPGATEVCDGIDDDCNGEVDNVDEDNDEVNDCVDDKCLNTIPWFAETLKPNHYDRSNIDLTATYGCNCQQILFCKPGENNGEYKFGCSQGTINVWMGQNPESWALDCQTDGKVTQAGVDKSMFSDTDGDWWIDGLDGDNDGDGLGDNEDDMTDDADLPGHPGHGTPDWFKK